MTDGTFRASISAFHTKAWGRPWPHQSKGTIFKTDIDDGKSDSVYDEESGSPDDDKKSGSVDDDEVVALADILKVPSKFNYDCFQNIQEVKRALGVDADADEGDVLVVREEYSLLLKTMERKWKGAKKFPAFVVTGHPGIGS